MRINNFNILPDPNVQIIDRCRFGQIEFVHAEVDDWPSNLPEIQKALATFLDKMSLVALDWMIDRTREFTNKDAADRLLYIRNFLKRWHRNQLRRRLTFGYYSPDIMFFASIPCKEWLAEKYKDENLTEHELQEAVDRLIQFCKIMAQGAETYQRDAHSRLHLRESDIQSNKENEKVKK